MTILEKATQMYQQFLLECQHYGAPKTLQSRLVAKVSIFGMRVAVKAIVKDLQNRGLEVDVKFNVVAVAKGNEAMAYDAPTHTVTIPITGVMAIWGQYQTPEVEAMTMKYLGRPLEPKEIVRELIAHEIGHSQDRRLKDMTVGMREGQKKLIAYSQNPSPTPEEARDILALVQDMERIALDMEDKAEQLGRAYADQVDVYDYINEINRRAYVSLYARAKREARAAINR